MKITSFEPLIVTKDAEDLIKLFEELGFERQHAKKGINGRDITAVNMKNADGFKVNVANSDRVPRDLTTIRMNVDDFDEAYNFLVSKGFKNAQGDKITETSSSLDTLMVSPSGFAITICKHIK